MSCEHVALGTFAIWKVRIFAYLVSPSPFVFPGMIHELRHSLQSHQTRGTQEISQQSVILNRDNE